MKVEEILEMSYPRRVVETIINGLQDLLNQHLIRLVGFEFSPELREHFREESEAWLDRIQRLRLKPHNRPGRFKFYYDLLFDYPFGGVEVENMQSMMDFIARRYPGCGHQRRHSRWSNGCGYFTAAWRSGSATGGPFST